VFYTESVIDFMREQCGIGKLLYMCLQIQLRGISKELLLSCMAAVFMSPLDM
jgi:hypothetical protein